MMSDNFIESVITPKLQSKEEAMNREFYGMMAVAAGDKEQHDNYDSDSTTGGDNE